jgi:hypothetical protein
MRAFLIKLPPASIQPGGWRQGRHHLGFVLTGDEVNPVVLALRADGIQVTAPGTEGVLSNRGRIA